MFQRCAADGADLVSLRFWATENDGVQYLYCPICSTAILALGPVDKAQVRIRYRYRKGDLFLLDPDEPRAQAHLDPLRALLAQFVKTGKTFGPYCCMDGSRVPIVAEAERLKLVWCSSCKLGTAYCARPLYGWSVAGTFGYDVDAAKYVLRDYRGPDDLHSLIESAVTDLQGSP